MAVGDGQYSGMGPAISTACKRNSNEGGEIDDFSKEKIMSYLLL